MASLSRIARTVLAGMLLLAASCEAPGEGGGAVSDPPVTGGGGGETDVGSVSMSLTIGGGFRFGAVSYDVSGNGFHKAASIDAGGSSTLSTLIGGIPFGRGYVLRLAAQDVDHKLMPCTGSSPFDITSPATVQLPVSLTCHEVPKPPAVPVPWWVSLGLGAFVLAYGAARSRRAFPGQ